MTAPRHGTRATGVGLAFCAPWLLGFVLFIAGPAITSLWASFTDASMVEPARQVGGANYARLISDTLFWRTLAQTTAYALVLSGLGTGGALALALLLRRRPRGAGVARLLILLPAAVPTAACGVLWIWLLSADYGPVNSLLSRFGVRGPGWLVSPAWVPVSLVLVGLWTIGPSVIILEAALGRVPRSLEEAASLDGAGRTARVWRIVVPAIAPVLLFVLVMAMIVGFQAFAVPFVLLGAEGGPERSGLLLAGYIYQTAFARLDLGYASAIAWVQLLVVLALSLVLCRLSRRTAFGADPEGAP
ncbi:MAG: sugar ABC transporter permease [Phycisphaerales bacterium]|nr:sugar ABC transporter permease [Phycisphaerales bacterium]